MGLRYRKSLNFGLFRINLSKSGIGYSVGTKGFRKTKRADGKIQTTYSIPNTGISYVDVKNKNEKEEVLTYKKRNLLVKILIYTFKYFKGFCSVMFWTTFIVIAICTKTFCFMANILNKK